MIEVAICDDEPAICTLVEKIITEYAESHYIELHAQVFYSGERLISTLNERYRYDLIYLDIELEGMNGVEVGRYIREELKDYTTEIVYISGKDGYDRQLFDAHPLHFIPKPIKTSIVIDDLMIVLRRANKLGGKFQYKKGQVIHTIHTDDIIYFESLNREIMIVTTKGENKFYGNLEEIIKKISLYQFILIHRSYLVNFRHIITGKYSEVIMSNGTKLPVSRAKRKELRHLMINEEWVENE